MTKRVGLPPFEWLPSFIGRAAMGQIDAPPEIVHGLLHRGCKMLLGGTSKSCKSWTMLELGLAVAGGKEWWGFETTKSRVLYVNFELPEWSLSKRISAMGFAMSVESRFSADSIPNFAVWNLRGYAADMAVLMPQLKAQVDEGGFGLIILDPLYKMLGANRDENDAASMGDVFNTLETLAQSSGAAIVVSHHYAKGNAGMKTPQDRVSGSGVLARDPDALVMLTPHDEEDVFVTEFVLRHHPRPAPFCVRWSYPMMRREENADPKDVKGHAGAPKKVTANDILEIVGTRLVTPPELYREVSDKHGVCRTTTQRRVRQMESDGQIIFSNGFLKAPEPQPQP
jgi:hypothetical protein